MEDFTNIYMYQLTNISATHVRVSEGNFREIRVVLQGFLPKVSKLQPTDLTWSLENWLTVQCELFFPFLVDKLL